MLTDFIRDKLITQLKYENGKLFGKFEVSFESVKVDYVIDRCREMDCVHQCQYHFYQLRFMCLCPDPRNAANFVPCQSQAVHRETLENAIKSIEETNNLDQIVIPTTKNNPVSSTTKETTTTLVITSTSAHLISFIICLITVIMTITEMTSINTSSFTAQKLSW